MTDFALRELLAGRDIVCIASTDWSELWQAHHEICSRLARDGSRVVYVENTGVRSPRLTDLRRVVHRARRWLHARRSGGVHHPAARLNVISPIVLPPFGSAARRRINSRLFVDGIARTIGPLVRDPIVWTFLPTDTALDAYDRIATPASRLVYYCISDFVHLTKSEAVSATERALVERADVVFVNGEQLADRFRQWRRDVHVFRVGVNLDAFTPGAAVADPLRDLPHPRIGCIGALHEVKSDFAFIAALARLRPHWNWIYVGPTPPHGELEMLPNIHLIGEVPHAELASYIEGFDVCTVPYRESEFMRTAVPTKINEYLAMGKPVVATPSVYAEELAAGGAILVAPHEPHAFVDAIESCFDEEPDRHAAGRRLFASRSDWNDRLAAMCAIVRSTL